MSTKKYYNEARANTTSLFMLRIFVRKLQTCLSFLEAGKRDHNCEHRDCFDNDATFDMPKLVPEDVKEGHFAVVAEKGSEKKRFILKLEWLNSKTFVKLLKMAEEEYGFEQTGALVVPCRPQELENILKAGLVM